MLPPDELVHRLDLALRQRIGGHHEGDVLARGLRGGMELDRIREWAPGDDWRFLDPASTARTGTPHVREPEAERRPVVWIGMDTSSSMAFGTTGTEKYEVASAAAATIGLIALRQSARVGGIPLTASPSMFPPRAGRPALVGLIENMRPGRADTAADMASGMDRILKAAKGNAIVVIASDFRSGLPVTPRSIRGHRGSRRDPGPTEKPSSSRMHDRPDWADALARLAHRHDVYCVEVFDRREQELPDIGIARFSDPETRQITTVDTGSADLRRRFAAAAEYKRQVIAQTIRSSGAEHIRIGTHDDWLDVLVRHLQQRRRSRWVSANR